jgi:hypothetical protein
MLHKGTVAAPQEVSEVEWHILFLDIFQRNLAHQIKSNQIKSNLLNRIK